MRLLGKITTSVLLLASTCHAQAIFRGQNVTTVAGATIANQSVCAGVNCASVESFSTSATITGLNMTPGWIVVCTISATSGSTLGCSDSKSNTYTLCKTLTANFITSQFVSVVSTGGTGITVTSSAAGAGFQTATVVAFSSSSGWPGTPCDQTGTASVGGSGGGTITATAGGANTQPAEVNYGVIMASNSLSGCISGGPTAGYAQQTTGSGVNNQWVYYKLPVSVETASFGATFSTCGNFQIVLATYKPN